MYDFFLSAHNILRWVVLALLLVNLLRHLSAIGKNFTATDKKLSLYLLISAHVMFLIGLYQWIAGPWGLKLLQANGMGEVMKNASYRFFSVEHPVGMLLAIILITLANKVGKRDLPHANKHRRMATLFAIALLVIIAVIPWPFREEIARPLFRV